MSRNVVLSFLLGSTLQQVLAQNNGQNITSPTVIDTPQNDNNSYEVDFTTWNLLGRPYDNILGLPYNFSPADTEVDYTTWNLLGRHNDFSLADYSHVDTPRTNNSDATSSPTDNTNDPYYLWKKLTKFQESFKKINIENPIFRDIIKKLENNITKNYTKFDMQLAWQQINKLQEPFTKISDNEIYNFSLKASQALALLLRLIYNKLIKDTAAPARPARPDRPVVPGPPVGPARPVVPGPAVGPARPVVPGPPVGPARPVVPGPAVVPPVSADLIYNKYMIMELLYAFLDFQLLFYPIGTFLDFLGSTTAPLVKYARFDELVKAFKYSGKEVETVINLIQVAYLGVYIISYGWVSIEKYIENKKTKNFLKILSITLLLLFNEYTDIQFIASPTLVWNKIDRIFPLPVE